MRGDFQAVDTSKHEGIGVFGFKGSGKSVVLERIAEIFLEDNKLVFDLYAAWGHENGFWVVKHKKAYKAIYVHPSYVKVHIPDDYKDLVTPMCDEVGLEAIVKEATKTTPPRVIIFLNSLYAEAHMTLTLIKLCEEIPYVTDELDIDSCVIIREADELASSSINIHRKGGAVDLKAVLFKLMKEGRHARCTMVYDMQELQSLFVRIRKLIDKVIMKTASRSLAPPEAQFVWDDIEKEKQIIKHTHRNSKRKMIREIRRLAHDFPLPDTLWNTKAYIISKGRVKLIDTTMPGFYHKKPGDKLYKITGIRFETDKGARDSLVASLFEKNTKENRNLLAPIKHFLILIDNLVQEDGYTHARIANLAGWRSPEPLSRFKKRHRGLIKEDIS